MVAGRRDLDSLTIRRPCEASWDAMEPVAGGRHCSLCQRSVRDLSMLTRSEAEALLRETRGGLCVRVVRHPDGRIVTRNAGERRSPGSAFGRLTRRLLGGFSLLAAACGASEESPGAGTTPHEVRASPEPAALRESAIRSAEEEARAREQLRTLGYVDALDEPSAEASAESAAAAAPSPEPAPEPSRCPKQP